MTLTLAVSFGLPKISNIAATWFVEDLRVIVGAICLQVGGRRRSWRQEAEIGS